MYSLEDFLRDAKELPKGRWRAEEFEGGMKLRCDDAVVLALNNTLNHVVQTAIVGVLVNANTIANQLEPKTATSDSIEPRKDLVRINLGLFWELISGYEEIFGDVFPDIWEKFSKELLEHVPESPPTTNK